MALLCAPWYHNWQLSDPPQPVECLKHLDHCFSTLHLWPVSVFICVWFERTLVCNYVVYCEAIRLPVIFSHFTCVTPLSTGYVSTAEANLVSIHILKVGSIPFSFCRKLKWEIIIGAIQISDAASNCPCSYQVLPSQRIHLEVPQILAFLNPFLWRTFNLVQFQSIYIVWQIIHPFCCCVHK